MLRLLKWNWCFISDVTGQTDYLACLDHTLEIRDTANFNVENNI